ncbi:phage tail protein [Pectinatus frisingensis]|uniref:gp53-like domain-containing protein n=1 Tax=Pectinatus frisingensis TaxID=865 RepID=UPI0018C70641|nr:phage tail protein [Pectinatus frisingensis]
MANWQGAILTTKGKALQAKVEAGTTKLALTKMKLGNGVISGSQTLEGLTDLVSPQQDITISSITPNSNGTCNIEGVVTNTSLNTGYYLKELGLYATDPDAGEILYAITTDSNPDYLQASGSATVVSESLNMTIIISNASSVTATIDPSGLVTVSDLAMHNTDINAHATLFAAKLNKSGDTATGLLKLATDLITNLSTNIPQTDNSGTLAPTAWIQNVLSNLVSNTAVTWSSNNFSCPALGINGLMAQNGYISFGPLFGGLILQWGYNYVHHGVASPASTIVTFPIAFNTAYSAVFQEAAPCTTCEYKTVTALLNTSFTATMQDNANAGDSYFYWMAIGK